MHQAKMIAEIDHSRLPRLLIGLSKSRLMNRDFVPSMPGDVMWQRAHPRQSHSDWIRWHLTVIIRSSLTLVTHSVITFSLTSMLLRVALE
jgi:hypothetical protein